jgi:lipopolysaccharide/colanic/teichoic acid biosynthesis glycosyltransferase
MKNFESDGISPPLMHPVQHSVHYSVHHDGQVAWATGVPANTNRRFAAVVPKIVEQASVKPAHSLYRGVGKRICDVLFVLATLPVSVPLIAFCALALALEGGRPFYRQDRLGRNGSRFSILKLRTMVRDADDLLASYLENDPVLREEWETTQKLKCDPRITSVGGFLRATSLDELPQLWNVLKGEMSLVGPRPMMPEQLPLYGDAHAYFAVQPGITGLWQVSARNENRFSVRCKVDAQYYSDMSLRFDIGLLIRTVGVVVRQTGY